MPEIQPAVAQHRDGAQAVAARRHHRRRRAERHPRHLAVARPGRGRRASRTAAQRIRDAGLVVTGYCRGGMFPAVDRAGRVPRATTTGAPSTRRSTLGARCLVLVVGGLPKDRDGADRVEGPRRRARDGARRHRRAARLRAAGRHAARDRAAASDVRGRPRVRQHDRARATTCATSSGRAASGIARRRLPRVVGSATRRREIERAGRRRSRLFAYHICDWLVPTTDLLNDRGMMGDGVDRPAARSARWMEAAGYRGLHEVEIFSDRWWAEDPRHVLATCIERHARCS